ncbi:MAG: alpha/beta hydrolase [Ilumatobacteraceae bacterium]|nr:alpha/beta hydrolase [Ilumatobacteraceae bacterium]
MVMIRGVDLVHDLSGEGPDVVWGHGLTSSMASEDELGLLDWSTIRSTHRVLRYDARGHGESGSTPEPEDYSWRALAADQLALADHLGIGEYVAGGASMGCATALHAAVIAPDRVRGLIFVIPPTAWERRAAQVDAYAMMADLIEAGDHETLLAGAAAAPAPDPFVDDPRWTARFPQLLASADPARLARIFRGAGTADLPGPAEIAAIGVPTLILAWTGDPGHPVTTAARLHELIDGSELALATTMDGIAGWSGRVRRFLDQA